MCLQRQQCWKAVGILLHGCTSGPLGPLNTLAWTGGRLWESQSWHCGGVFRVGRGGRLPGPSPPVGSPCSPHIALLCEWLLAAGHSGLLVSVFGTATANGSLD